MLTNPFNNVLNIYKTKKMKENVEENTMHKHEEWELKKFNIRAVGFR